MMQPTCWIARWIGASLLSDRCVPEQLPQLIAQTGKSLLFVSPSAPDSALQACGTLVATPILSGLHHRYARI
jgi:hypothetical protein